MSEVLPMIRNEMTPEQLKLITDVVAKGATPDEMKLFLYRCKSMDLDPLKPGQIYFIKYGNGPGTIVVGIEGFRVKAAKTGKHSGTEREIIRDASGKALGAKAKVYRKDWAMPAVIEVSLAEYNTGKGPWAKMPESMIAKVAEAGALRMAFPDELGGVYTKEEMDQAERDKPAVGTQLVVPEQPGPQDGVGDAAEHFGYRIPAGKFAKRSLEEVDLEQLRQYVQWMENNSIEKNKPLSGWQVEFVERASEYIGAMENA